VVKTKEDPFEHNTDPPHESLSMVDASTIENSGLFDARACVIPTLTFLSGDALGKELPLLQQQVTIGRGEGSDILIADPSVSRRHIQLTCRKLVKRETSQDLKVVLRDLGSKNGTLVNYRRVRSAVLKPGDKIILGKVILKFEFKDVADQKLYDEIYRLATVDNLTGLLNKASITRNLAEELDKRTRYRGKLSILLMDLDHFKSLNDMHGHLIGDRALQAAGAILQRNLRRQDKAGRFGGEEFLIVLPETGMQGAAASAERMRIDLETSLAAEIGIASPLTASFGAATFPEDGGYCENLLEHADQALYRAKARGRNRVELYREDNGQSAQMQE
jgi:two-component system cell cycle response regulator